MRIPHRVRVDREWYRVVYGDPNQAAKSAGDPDKDPLGGFCDSHRKLITLRASLRTNRRLREWTFWHEVAHAFDFEYALGLSHGQVDRLGRSLAYLCEDNLLSFGRAAEEATRGRKAPAPLGGAGSRTRGPSRGAPVRRKVS